MVVVTKNKGALGSAQRAGIAFSFDSLLFPTTWSANCSYSASSFPSTASFNSDIVLSMLRLRVLGLVIVVPKLACRPWPRRNGIVGPVLDDGEEGVGGPMGLDGALDKASSSAAATPLGGTSLPAWESSPGVWGSEDEMYALPSSESASTSSGGSRSFSISDLRLEVIRDRMRKYG